MTRAFGCPFPLVRLLLLLLLIGPADQKILPLDSDGRGPRHEQPSAVAISACGGYAIIGGASGSVVVYNLENGLPRGRYAVAEENDWPKPRKAFVARDVEPTKRKLGSMFEKPLEDIGRGDTDGVGLNALGPASVWTSIRALFGKTGLSSSALGYTLSGARIAADEEGEGRIVGAGFREGEAEEDESDSDEEEYEEVQVVGTIESSWKKGKVMPPFAHRGAVTFVGVDATNTVSRGVRALSCFVLQAVFSTEAVDVWVRWSLETLGARDPKASS